MVKASGREAAARTKETPDRRRYIVSVLLVRAKLKDEHVEEAEAAAKKMFAAVNEAQPQGVRYASTKVGGSGTFVAILQLEDGIENPLPGLPAWREFGEALEEWRAEPPVAEQLEVVGSYRLFS
jgi:hypothetical protein